MDAEDGREMERKGTWLAEHGNFLAAISMYKTAIEQRPDSAALHEQLSQCLLETGQYQDAYQAASQAYSLAPQWPEAMLTLARCSLNNGLLPEASQYYTQYLDKQPNNTEVQAEWAEVNQLQQEQLAVQIGLPGLCIEQLHGAQGGPGHMVWQAGIMLSQYFVLNPGLVTGKQVLELGCGTGIVGITLACLGAKVTLTDTAAIAPCTKYNIVRNQQLIAAGKGSAVEAVLDWERLEGAQPVLLGAYDVVVGADLIYAAKDIQPLTDTLRRLQHRSSKYALVVAHKDRSSDITDHFLAQLHHSGFPLHQVHHSGVISIHSTYTAEGNHSP